MKIVSYYLLSAIALLLMVVWIAVPYAQDKPATAAVSEYKPTEIQALRLENLQLKAINAQKQSQIDAQAATRSQQLFNDAVNVLSAECGKVKEENKWPKDIVCDINQSPIPFMTKAEADELIRQRQQQQGQVQAPATPTSTAKPEPKDGGGTAKK